ncbi:AAA family ATPase [Acidianus manzaensis]|uniref:AAA family ATPase n=1 Tax=Acidianus manzaensis TaxID=282676 RepID=UPI001C9C1EF0|nr:hypothetical protein [Acidianus manzaensis]
MIIGLDEVQELSSVSKQFLDILGNVYASNPKIHFIFSGSYVGLVKLMLDPSSSSPIHGRPPVELKLKPFDKNSSTIFLKRGMEELNVTFDKYEEVIEKLDGVVGWLTLFGNFYGVRKMNFDSALRNSIKEGKKIMTSEFEHFLSYKRNKELYIHLMEITKIVKR